MRGRETNTAERSPVSAPTLARAGEGLDRKIREEFEWNAFYFLGVAIALISACLFAWTVEFFSPGAGLPTLTVATVFTIAYIGWRLWKARAPLHQLRLGMRGEVAVGEALDALRERGYRVFHDVGSEGRGNIDHVVIGPSGIYVIETKTRSLPPKGRAAIRFDGRRVRLGDGPWDERPIRQACAVRARMREWLKGEGMGEWEVNVRAVVMYPGWWVDGSSGKDVWVLKPDALGTWIATEERKTAPVARDRLEMLWGRFEKYARELAERERAGK